MSREFGVPYSIQHNIPGTQYLLREYTTIADLCRGVCDHIYSTSSSMVVKISHNNQVVAEAGRIIQDNYSIITKGAHQESISPTIVPLWLRGERK